MAYKHVTPALSGAQIPDPAHGGILPADGSDVVWSPYWIALLARGEITAYDVPDPVAGGSLPPSGPVLAADTVVLLMIGGVNYPFTLADLRTFLGVTSGASPGDGSAPATNLDLSQPLGTDNLPVL